MAVTPQENEFLNFVAGLSTEAGYFTFPPNTWKEGFDMVPQVNGALYRRKGFDFENLYNEFSVAATQDEHEQWAYGLSTWESVGGQGDRNFFVAQIGPQILFYEATGGSVSATKKAFSINLAGTDSNGVTIKAPGNPSLIGSSPITTTSADGKLVIVSQDTLPLYVEYNSVGDTITTTTYTLQIRDFAGLDDGLSLDHKWTPAEWAGADGPKHNYNLLNQGWYAAQIATYLAGTGTYPSNTQSWIYGKDTTGAFSATFLDKIDFGLSLAPRGRFFLDVFRRDRSAVSGVAGITVETESYRPSAVAFFAGRAWYSGVTNSTEYGSTVFFTQTLTSFEKIGKCYQDQDPTAEVFNDLVDTDGGVVKIPDAGQIVSLYPITNGILVFANNGVWKIGGTANEGFTARSYEVVKVTNFGCVSGTTVVSTDYGVLFWSASGIFSIVPDNTGKLEVSNLAETTVQSLYNNIPSLSKKYAVGAFNESTKLVYWLYSDLDITTAITDRYKKSKVLVFDLRLKCFYSLTISEVAGGTSPYIFSVRTTEESTTASQTFDVVDSLGNMVEDAALNQVTVDLEIPEGGVSVFKFLTITYTGGNNVVTFSDLLNQYEAPSKWKDWFTYDATGTDVVPYILTGYNFGPVSPSRRKQAVYMTMYMERTETRFDGVGNAVNGSSCIVEPRWDFSDNTIAGKFGPSQEVYRHTRVLIPDFNTPYIDGLPLVVTKNKIRGRGRALQLKFTGDPDLDMRLVGWSVPILASNSV